MSARVKINKGKMGIIALDAGYNAVDLGVDDCTSTRRKGRTEGGG